MVNTYVVRGAVVGALGGLLFGFDTAVIAGTTHSLTTVFALTPVELGYTVAIALVGTVLGAAIAGPLESRFGGRSMLRVMALLYIVSAVGCAFAPDWAGLLVARFIGGIGIGGSSVIGPVYIAEISPARLRGRLVGMFQINIVIGVLLAYLSNYLIARHGFGAMEWRWEFGVAAIPAVAFFGLLFGIPRSARWLVAAGHTEEAAQVLRLTGEQDPERELNAILASVREDASASAEKLFQRKYSKPILLAVVLATFNQFSGINAIVYYLNDLFAGAGFSSLDANLRAVPVGLMNLLATLLGMALIDKLGRKTLLLIGSVGCSFSLAGVAYVFASKAHPSWLLPLLLNYIFFFAISQGAVIWVYLSEIFPTRVRGKGQGLGSGTHWVMNAAIASVFPIIIKSSVVYAFVFFALMMVLQFFVVWRVFPETKGASLEQLQAELSR